MASIRGVITENKGKPQGHFNPNIGGIPCEVVNKKPDGTFVVRAYMDTPLCNKGDEFELVFQDSTRTRCLENIKRGMGGTPGSILMLENCRIENGKIIAQWVTTAVSAAKKMDESTGHNRREVERHYLCAPTISFKEADGFVKFSIFDDRASYFRNNDGRYTHEYISRDEAVQKLASQEDHSSAYIYSLSLKKDEAFVASSLDEAINKINESTQNREGAAIVRLSDNEGTVLVSEFGHKNNGINANQRLFRDIPNDVLSEEIANGNWTLEIIPAERIPYLGDTKRKIVSDIVDNGQKTIANRYGKIFGEGIPDKEKESQESEVDFTRHMVTDCAVVVMKLENGGKCIVSLPIPLIKKHESLKDFAAKKEDPPIFDFDGEDENQDQEKKSALNSKP